METNARQGGWTHGKGSFGVKRWLQIVCVCLFTVFAAQAGDVVVGNGQTVSTIIGSGRSDNNSSVHVENGGLVDTGNSTAISLGDSTLNTSGTLRLDADVSIDSLRGVFLNAGGGTIYTQGNTGVVDAQIDGLGALTKTGTGTLVLGNAANSYAGGTNVLNGTVAIADGNALGGGPLFLGDSVGNTTGTLRLDADADLGSRRATLVSGSATVDTQGYSGVIGGAVDGAGKLVKAGGGTLALYGSNSYQGGTDLNQGTLAVNSGQSLGADGTLLTMQDQTTLRLDADVDLSTRPVTLASGVGTVDTQSNTGFVRGNIDGAGKLAKAGDGTLVLYGANTYQGGTDLNQGTLAIDSDQSLGAGGALLTMQDQTMLRLDADVAMTSRPVTLASGAATIDTQTNTGLMQGNVDGDGKLVKTGSGTLVLYGINSYRGGTDLNQGLIAINSDQSLGAAGGRLTMQDQTTLRLDADADMTSRPVTLASGAGTVDTQGNTGWMRGNVDGAGRLVKEGAGTVRSFFTATTAIRAAPPSMPAPWPSTPIIRWAPQEPDSTWPTEPSFASTTTSPLTAGSSPWGQALRSR